MTITLDGTNGITTPEIVSSGGPLVVDSGAPDNSVVVNSAGNLKAVATISVGNATPSTSGAGITFPATVSASSDANTLDDYEEGTWTPTLNFSGGTTGITYSFRNGLYTKIGNLVFIRVTIVLSSKGSSSGDAAVAGLPFTTNSTAGGTGFTLTFSRDMASITGNVINEPEASSTEIRCFQTTSTDSVRLTNSNFTNSSNYQFSGCYQV
jgi:hypothetical protein